MNTLFFIINSAMFLLNGLYLIYVRRYIATGMNRVDRLLGEIEKQIEDDLNDRSPSHPKTKVF